jgi:hypothetical protein
MKKYSALLVIAFAILTLQSVAQTVKVPGVCKPYLDSVMLKDLTLEEATKWCESVPPKIKCDNDSIYILNTFEISIFTLNPMQNKQYGIGEGGVPLLAQNAIKNLKKGDTIILKNASYLDSGGKAQKLPVISFPIK